MEDLKVIKQHDALRRFPLDDCCIDVCMTSPPYWGLRDYGVDGQIGLESHPQDYIDHIVQVAREVKRVLKKSGSFYLNLGDTYCSFGGLATPEQNAKSMIGATKSGCQKGARHITRLKDIKSNWLQPKQLMLIPSRVAVALQDDGWILRNDIVWHKPNPMPSSVRDRLNCTWEHVFHLVRSRKYYYNLDKIREPHKPLNRWGGNVVKMPKNTKVDLDNQQYAIQYRERLLQPNPQGKNPGDVIKHPVYGEDKGNRGRMLDHLHQQGEHHYHDIGKNPGDYWDICTQPFTSFRDDMEHFAVFPETLVEKPLKASCPDGGVVLDPFCGRGTVGKVARSLGLGYVLFDLNPSYVELARLFVNGQKRKLIKYQNKLEVKET